MITLGQLGTFDVENYGDLLYPIIFRQVLKRYNKAQVRVRAYSFLDGSAPQAAGFETTAMRSLFDPAMPPPNRMVIGGGDILRTDRNMVAEHYRRAHNNHYGRLLRSIGIINFLPYLLFKHLPLQAGHKFYSKRFKTRWMNHQGAGPFLIDPDDLPGNPLVCYLSCGVPHEFTAAERDTVSRTFNKADFIYLRDEQSREKLRRAGVTREMRVAPDLIVTLGDYFDHAAEAEKGRAILSQRGVDGARPVLCFQSNPYSKFPDDEIIKELKHYRQRTGSEVVLLPLGYCHGDHIFLKRLAKKSGGDFKYIGVHSIYDIISVIAACSIFVGTSLHGNITAFSFGIPHLYAPLLVDKAEGFLRVVNLPPELKMHSWSETNDKIEMALRLGGAFFSERAREAKLKVYRVVDEMFENFLK